MLGASLVCIKCIYDQIREVTPAKTQPEYKEEVPF